MFQYRFAWRQQARQQFTAGSNGFFASAYLDVLNVAMFSDESFPVIPDWDARGTTNPKEMILITQSLKELQLLMSDYVGIVRNNVRLERASRRLDLLFEEIEELYRSTSVSPQLCELRNMITVGYLIVKSAQFREESRGLHYNTDYLYKSNLLQNIVL
jgi:L-aspartate oxidase